MEQCLIYVGLILVVAYDCLKRTSEHLKIKTKVVLQIITECYRFGGLNVENDCRH